MGLPASFHCCSWYFLHQIPGSPSLTSFSGEDGAKCVEVPQYSTTNLDILNVDVSSRKILDTAREVKCNCDVDWKTVLEWGIFEIVSVILLVCIFCWLCVGDGLAQCKSFVKKRSQNTERQQREYERAVKKQEKLTQKMGKTVAAAVGQDVAIAQAPTESKPPFCAV